MAASSSNKKSGKGGGESTSSRGKPGKQAKSPEGRKKGTGPAKKSAAVQGEKSRLVQALERELEEHGKGIETGLGETNREFLCVQIASNRYAFETRDVLEVVPPGHVTQVPHTPEYIEGLIARHGRVTAVLNLALYRGGGNPANEVARMVIVHSGELEAAIPVHDVLGIVNVSEAQVESLWGKATAEGNFVVGQLSLEEGVHSIIDVEKLLQGGRLKR